MEHQRVDTPRKEGSVKIEHGTVESYDPVTKRGRVQADNGDFVYFRLEDGRFVRPICADHLYYGGSLDGLIVDFVFFPKRTVGVSEVVAEPKEGDLLVFIRKKWPFMRPIASPWGPGKPRRVYYPNSFGGSGGSSGHPL